MTRESRRDCKGIKVEEKDLFAPSSLSQLADGSPVFVEVKTPH
jgi:hypothetical protein